MTSVEPWYVPLVMVTVLLVLPFGVPLVALSTYASRRESRLPLVLVAVGSAASGVFWIWFLAGRSPPWPPYLFLIPLIASVAALARPSSLTRRFVRSAAWTTLGLMLGLAGYESCGAGQCMG